MCFTAHFNDDIKDDEAWLYRDSVTPSRHHRRWGMSPEIWVTWAGVQVKAKVGPRDLSKDFGRIPVKWIW